MNVSLSRALLGIIAMLHGISHAAIFDFTPAAGIGTVEAQFIGTGVALSISGQNAITVPCAKAQDLTQDKGVVAWSSDSTVYSYVFDEARGSWKGTSSTDGPTSDLSSVDGLVAWSKNNGNRGVFFRVYDPMVGNWITGGGPGPISEAQLLNARGVVAWSTNGFTGYRVFFTVYDPTRNGWRNSNTALNDDTFDLRTADGVVAWSVNPIPPLESRVDYQVYDPLSGQWRGGAVLNSGSTTDLNIQNSQVTWNSPTAPFFRGYNPNTGQWVAGLPTPLAFFAVSTSAGNAPFYVSFIDMSIGGTSWSLNFGDGTGSVAKRAHTHAYTNFGRFTATQTVNGSTTSRTILTDISPPAGIITINGGAAFTTNRNVLLTLSATDNSGLATSMRFSNEGTNWSDWEAFATSKAWPLGTNNGTRTVSAQFRDTASNTSAVTSATILLDTSPLPIVSLVNTSAEEDSGTITVTARLDHSYSQRVAINYTTSNGTATASSDYEAKSGLLTFAPNTTSTTFTLTIKEDALVELDETVLIHFSAISNAVSGLPGVITILDNDLTTVAFAQTNYNTIESNTAIIAVRLSAPTGKAVIVQYAATNGTATAGLDYTPTQGFLTFPPGETNLAFGVALSSDPLDEFPETINLQLLSATNAVLVTPTNATLTIIDDDNPLVYFNSSSYTVTENTGFAEIHVWLSKPFSKPVKVRYSTSGGTAIPGLGNDYLAVAADLEFSIDPLSEDATNQFFFVNLVNDSVAEPIKTIHLRLTSLRDASPGLRTEADIVLIDDDAPPQFTLPTLTTNGLLQITLIGKPGQRFDIEYSGNMVSWFHLATLTNTTGTLQYTHPILSNSAPRFYRTKLLP